MYILGGLDEIMALLDDSVVNISTIAGSRHVGPIKPRVEDWQKQLALFADTLVSLFYIYVAIPFIFVLNSVSNYNQFLVQNNFYPRNQRFAKNISIKSICRQNNQMYACLHFTKT